MISTTILLILVLSFGRPVLTCKRPPRTCRDNRIIIGERLPIETYKTLYQINMRKWSQPQAITSSITSPQPDKPLTTVTTPVPEVNESNPISIRCGTLAVEKYQIQRVIAGNNAPEKRYPWQVYIRGIRSFCGGVLISSVWVLTAAHCISNTQYILLGTTNLAIKSPNMVFRTHEKEFLHEQYVNGGNDIALIKMNESVKFNDYIRPACLPDKGADFMDVDCYVTGWGLTDYNMQTLPYLLQEAKVSVMSYLECFIRWFMTTVRIRPGHLCTKQNESSPTSGICSGDSGGPLSCIVDKKYYVAGIASISEINCRKDSIPDLFTKVSHYRKWIEEKIYRNT